MVLARRLLAISGINRSSGAPPPANDANVPQTWLKNYGYLPAHAGSAPHRPETVRQAAVASMQRFYGIPVTGRLDQTTVE